MHRDSRRDGSLPFTSILLHLEVAMPFVFLGGESSTEFTAAGFVTFVFVFSSVVLEERLHQGQSLGRRLGLAYTWAIPNVLALAVYVVVVGEWSGSSGGFMADKVPIALLLWGLLASLLLAMRGLIVVLEHALLFGHRRSE